MSIRLRPVRSGDEAVATAAHAELQHDGFTFLLDHTQDTPWRDYVHRLAQHQRGLELPADRVAATFLFAWNGDDLVGRVSIRHELTDFLLHEGGHIGYAVRPAFRRRGFATEMLGQALIIARAQGIDDVLVTCDDENIGSARVIESQGGRLDDVRTSSEGRPIRRYWIR